MFGKLFGNKDKHNTDINELNKRDIMTALETARTQCRDVSAATLIRQIQTEIQSQTATSAEGVSEIDGKILEHLSKAQSSIKRGQPAPALMALIDAYEFAIDRSDYCQLGGQLSKREQRLKKEAEKARKKQQKIEIPLAEQLQDEIDELEEQNETLAKKIDMLVQLDQENPGNATILARYDALCARYDGNKEIINQKQDDLLRETTIDVTISVNTSSTADMGRSTHTDADVDFIRAERERLADARDERRRATADLRESLHSGATRSTAGGLSRVGGASGIRTAGGATTAATPTLQSVRATSPGQSLSRPGVPGANPGKSAQAKQRDNERALDAITDDIDAINEKIQAAQIEQTNCSAKLRRLLEKRRTASPAECTKLDSDIIQLKRQLSSVIHTLNTYDQAKQNLEVELRIVQADQDYTDIDAMNERRNKITGNIDFKQRAMDVRDRTNKANETHSEYADAESVIDSVDVEKEEFEDFAMDAAPAKDDDKFADLERFLGMTN